MGVISANGFTVFLGWYGSFGLGMFFPAMERTKDRRGLAPGSASTPVACPRTPVTGDASREPAFGRRRGRGGDCFRFPAAAADLAVSGERSGWTRKARRLPPDVEAGSSTAGGWGHPPLRKAAVFGVGADVPSARCPPPGQTVWYKLGGLKWERAGLTFAPPGPSGPEGGAKATQGLPAGRDRSPKGPLHKRRFGSFAAVGKGTRRRGGGTLL